MASLKTFVGKEDLYLTISESDFTLEDLIIKLTDEIGNNFKDMIINKKTKGIKSEILIFINNAEAQTLQNLKTALSEGDQITFISSIHGG